MRKGFVLWLMLLLSACSGEKETADLAGYRVTPPKPVNHMVLMSYDRQAYPVGLLKGQWSYLLFANDECNQLCQEQIRLTGAIADKAGVQRVLVAGYEPAAEFVQHLTQQQPDIKLAVLTRAIWPIFTVQFQAAIQQMGEGAFLLINPDGLLVMAYDDMVSAEQLVNDLQLLRSTPASH